MKKREKAARPIDKGGQVLDGLVVDEPYDQGELVDQRTHISKGDAIKVASALIFGAALFTGASFVKSQRKSETISVNVDRLPKQLPLAVKEDIDNVGAVYQYDYKTDGAKMNKPEGTIVKTVISSGVEINDQYSLTAGHSLVVNLNAKDGLFPPNVCMDITFSTPTFLSQVYLETSDYTKADDHSFKTPDASIMNTSWGTRYVMLGVDKHDVKISPTRPVIGQALFFVDYEPLPDGGQRYPYGPSSKDGPAIYGGIYDGTVNGDYNVVDGLKSYGRVDQSVSIPGASGGGVFNAEGQLVGINSQHYSGFFSATTYNKYFGISLTGLSGGAKVEDTLVQPINSKLLESLESHIKLGSHVCRLTDSGN